jgi:hypothetical protein
MPYRLFVQWVEFFNRLEGNKKGGGGGQRQQQTAPSSGPDWRRQMEFFKAFSIVHNAQVAKNAKSRQG